MNFYGTETIQGTYLNTNPLIMRAKIIETIEKALTEGMLFGDEKRQLSELIADSILALPELSEKVVGVTDEEISQESVRQFKAGWKLNQAFIDGAKWMRDKYSTPPAPVKVVVDLREVDKIVQDYLSYGWISENEKEIMINNIRSRIGYSLSDLTPTKGEGR